MRCNPSRHRWQTCLWEKRGVGNRSRRRRRRPPRKLIRAMQTRRDRSRRLQKLQGRRQRQGWRKPFCQQTSRQQKQRHNRRLERQKSAPIKKQIRWEEDSRQQGEAQLNARIEQEVIAMHGFYQTSFSRFTRTHVKCRVARPRSATFPIQSTPPATTSLRPSHCPTQPGRCWVWEASSLPRLPTPRQGASFWTNLSASAVTGLLKSTLPGKKV